MKEERKKLLKEWRDISWWDKLRSKFQATPATFGKYNQAYSHCLLDIITDPNLEIVEISKYEMLVTLEGESYSFWIANYPYSYGTLNNLPSGHKWFHSGINWEAVLEVRKLQMKYKKSFFAKYDEEQKQL